MHNEPKRVLIVTPFLSGTFYDWMARLLNEQRKDQRFDIRVIAYSGRISKIFRFIKRYRPDSSKMNFFDPTWVSIHKENVYPAGFFREHGINQFIKQTPKRLESQWSGWKPELIHVHWTWPFGRVGMDLAKFYNCPFVVTAHGGGVHQIGSGNKKVKREVLSVCRTASLVTCVGHSLKDSLVQHGISDQNISVIYNGVDLNLIHCIQKKFYKQYPRNKIILSSGGLIDKKGHHLTIKAFARLIKIHSNIELWIIGIGPEERFLKKLAGQMGVSHKVKFKGRVSFTESVMLMCQSDIFCLPSKKEGFGLVYIEALACGLPVIITQGQGIYNLIEEWNAGILVEPDSEESVAHALTVLMENPDMAKEMALNGQVRVLRNFSWECSADKYNHIYNDIKGSAVASSE